MEQCKNCLQYGLAKVKGDSAILSRKCVLCGWQEEVTKEMKEEAGERGRMLRP